MNVRALLETPHRSVHWSLVGKLRTGTAKGDPGQCFAEWRKLLSWDVATKAPHVFTEAVGHVAHLVLAGRLEATQVCQLLTALVVAPQGGRRSSVEATAVSAVVQALVQLLSAGADQLVLSPGRSARDNILRLALERNPSLWIHVLQHIRDLVAPSALTHSAGVDTDRAPAQSPEAIWANVRIFLRYAVLDPTVPAWAQGRAVNTVFGALHELARAGRDGLGYGHALAMLEWAVNVAADMVQPIGSPGPDPESAPCVADVQGRCDPHQLTMLCVDAAEYLCSLAVSSDPSDEGGAQASLHCLAAIVSRLRLLTASMSLTDLFSSDQTRQTHSPRMSGDRSTLAASQMRLLRSALRLLERCPNDATDGAECASPDVLVWATAAHRIADALSAAEQAHLLDVVATTVANRALAARIPAPALALMRFPLLCVASDGFSRELSSKALRLCEDIDQMPWQSTSGADGSASSLQLALEGFAGCKWVTGAAPLLVSALRDYAAIHAAMHLRQEAASRPSPLGGMAGLVEAVADRPLLLAPLLFMWSGSGSPADSAAALPKLALAALLRLLPLFPVLRMSLLPLFMYALRQPGAPAGLCQPLLLHAIPCLASTSDAYATSRVVAVVSGIWRRCCEGAAPYPAKRRAEALRLCCLALRGWANVVACNPRVWRDLKPAISQFVEAKKAHKHQPGAQQAGGAPLVAEPEYEWTVLATIRDLVQRDPDRYADQLLPFVYSLLSYAQEQLSASSVALLVDTARISVESRAADVRSVWETIVARPADHWIALAAAGDHRAGPALESLARFITLVGTHGEGTDLYAAFRRDVMLRYVAPVCGFAVPSTDAPGAPDSASGSRPPPDLPPQTRDLFLSALAAFPADEVLPLLSTGTPGQVLHELLAQVSRGQSAVAVAQRATHAGSLADLLASLMDNEVRFMRRSLFKGSTTFAWTGEDDGEGDDGDDALGPPGQRRSWARSNLDRSQWVYDALSPALVRAGETYWRSGERSAGPASMLALATMAGSVVVTAAGQAAAEPEADSSAAQPAPGDNGAESGARAQQVAARLGSLLVDASLADHWCIRNAAVDGWQMWFARSLQDVRQAGDSDAVGTVAAAVDALVAVLRDMLQSSHIPARLENALYALSGLVRAVEHTDQALASETAARVGEILLELHLLPYTQSPGEFWLAEARSRNEGVLAATVECAGQVALTNSHDTAALSQVVQFLMAGLSAPNGGQERLPPLVVQAVGRALTRLYVLLAGSRAAAPETYGGDQLAIEAGDIRRCVERLDVLQAGGEAADIGSVGLALALGVMHRHWIVRIINPAMAERNSTPQAAQARRSVARTLALAFENLKLAENGQWSARSIPSLYYLCFVWPPRPILQRHVELHGDLFTVTPERVWQAATRLVHRLWSSAENAADATGVRSLDTINYAEIAVAALAYHLLMTAHQSTAHSAYKQLVQRYSEWARGETGDVELAADERSSLRANRTVALAILLGLPLHGVPETTVSNSYLPLLQRKCLPVLLGIGSVKFGSTAWLRAPEADLQQSLGALMACSGLAEHLEREDTEDDAPGGAGGASGAARDDPELWHTHGGAAVEGDVGDVRVARIASFALGALRSQAAQAVRFLLLDAQNGPKAAPPTSEQVQVSDVAQAPSGALLAAGPGMNAAPVEVEAAAAGDEPKSLGHLPAPTSWCRALWEAIGELSESLADDAGAAVPSVEARLMYLLLAMLRAARPFPVVDSRKVLGRLTAVYLGGARAADLVTARMPLLLLVVKVASKLSPTMHSMAQFLDDTVLQIARTVAGLARNAPASGQYTDNVVTDTLPSIALACVGEIGLGRILSLSGLTSSNLMGPPETGSPDATDNICDSWTAHMLPGRLLTSADVVRITGSETLHAQRQLAAAIAQRAPLPPRDAAVAPSKALLASDAARMFHMMSKVAISSPKSANTCTSLMGILFAERKTAVPASEHPAALALQAQTLATLVGGIADADARSSRELTRDAARTKITAEVAGLLSLNDHDEGLLGAEQRVQLWGVVSVACGGANTPKGAELLALDVSDSSDGEFGSLVSKQALVLQQWISCCTPAAQEGGPLGRRAPWMADMLAPHGAAGGWLKRTFKEWARRTALRQQPATATTLDKHILASLQCVACALFARRTDDRRTGDAEAREWIIRGLDLVILAASMLSTGKGGAGETSSIAPPGQVDLVLFAGTVCWLLPLLMGHVVALGDDASCQSELLDAAAREMLEYVELGPRARAADATGSAGSQPRQFAAQLCARAVGLHDLVGPSARRCLRLVLASLAVLGKVPTDDMGRAL